MLGKMLMLERFIILILTQGDVREIIRGGEGELELRIKTCMYVWKGRSGATA